MAVCGSVCGYTGVPANANLYRPYQGWGTIDDMEMGATSNYNSLQVSFRTQEWKGLTFQESYTWSHAFDIIDGELFAAIDNPFNASWDYGPAGWDRRQMSITNFVYKLPFFKDSANHTAKTVAGGWTLSGILTLESGTPMSIGSESDNLGFGGGTGNRANIVAPVSYEKTRFEWFSTSSFAEPAALQWGSAAKNDVVARGATIGTWLCSRLSSSRRGPGSSSESRPSTPSTTHSGKILTPRWAAPNLGK
jgi:hypothetical protein